MNKRFVHGQIYGMIPYQLGVVSNVRKNFIING